MSRGGMTNFTSFARRFDQLGSAPLYIRLASVPILIGALVCLMDLLAVTTHEAVGEKAMTWLWGAQEPPSGNGAGATLSSLQPTSLDLLIKISGDELTAQYKVIASGNGRPTSI
jgi:hypothetical protein